MSINISCEEKFLINLLFNESEKDVGILRKINYEELVKIASSHLMLPALYINLKKKKYLKYIPEELKIYLKEIYKINRERNKILIGEIKEISQVLNKNKIEHVFLKGSAHVVYELYSDIGERMIGDIDVLTYSNQSNVALKILNENGYSSRDNKIILFNEKKHHLRQTKKNKIFAIEIHKKLLTGNNLKYIKQKSLLKNKKFKNGIFVPSLIDQLKHNIYNYQINDYGGMKLSYSFRSFYDSYMIIKQGKINDSNLNYDKYINKYFMIADELNLENLKFSKNKNMFDLIRFKTKHSNRLFFYFDTYLSNQLIKFKNRPRQISEFIFNKSYRKYIIMKIFKKVY